MDHSTHAAGAPAGTDTDTDDGLDNDADVSPFVFALGQLVHILPDLGGAEVGEVIGRAEYIAAETSYYVRYVAGDGRAVESWWGEGALRGVSQDELERALTASTAVAKAA